MNRFLVRLNTEFVINEIQVETWCSRVIVRSLRWMTILSIHGSSGRPAKESHTNNWSKALCKQWVAAFLRQLPALIRSSYARTPISAATKDRILFTLQTLAELRSALCNN